MNKPISSGLRTTFLVHFILGLIFGLLLLLIPEAFLGMLGWKISQPAVYRLVGAAILGFTVSSWFGYRAATWDQVRIVVLAELVWAPLATLVNLWGMISAEFPPSAWVNIVIFGGFAIAFWIFYNQQEAAAAVKAPTPKAPAPKAPARKVARRKRARA
jgi:hypothetical protein